MTRLRAVSVEFLLTQSLDSSRFQGLRHQIDEDPAG